MKLGTESQTVSYNKTIGAFFLGKHKDLLTLESEVQRGEAEVNITVLGLTHPNVNLKRMYHLYSVNAQLGKMSNFDLILDFVYVRSDITCQVH